MTIHRNIVKGLFIFILCSLNVGCTGPAIALQSVKASQIHNMQPTETGASTYRTASLIPTSTSTIKPTIRPTRTRRPTWTTEPTHTPTMIRPTKAMRIDPKVTMTAQAIELRKTQIANYPVICDDVHRNDMSLSPYGSWLAISCGYSHDQTLEIYRKTGRQWELQFKDYLAKEFVHDGATPMGGLIH